MSIKERWVILGGGLLFVILAIIALTPYPPSVWKTVAIVYIVAFVILLLIVTISQFILKDKI